MTTKQVKKSKPAAKAFDPNPILTDLGVQIGLMDSGVSIVGKASIQIEADCKALRDAKVTFGKSRRTCQMLDKVYNAMPASLASSTRDKYLSAIKAAVNQGKAFSMNPHRKAGGDAKTAKGGKGKGAKQGSGNILISIGKGAKPEDAADKLRKGFNALKAANDGLAKLAAFLIDALDDAGYPEKPTK